MDGDLNGKELHGTWWCFVTSFPLLSRQVTPRMCNIRAESRGCCFRSFLPSFRLSFLRSFVHSFVYSCMMLLRKCICIQYYWKRCYVTQHYLDSNSVKLSTSTMLVVSRQDASNKHLHFSSGRAMRSFGAQGIPERLLVAAKKAMAKPCHWNWILIDSFAKW